MTKRELLEIVIKAAGLYLLIPLINAIKDLSYTIIFIVQPELDTASIIYIAAAIFTVLAYLFLIFLFLFRTRNISQKISGSSWDEKIAIQPSSSDILRVALILIGAILITSGVTSFLNDIRIYTSTTNIPYYTRNWQIINLALSVLKVMIGFILIVYSNPLARDKKVSRDSHNQFKQS